MRHLIAALMLAATPASADLNDERTISEGLILIGIAYEISEVCPDIAPRRLRGLNALLTLRSMAYDLGYSRAEVEAYIDDDAEKDRLEAIARQRLERLGAKPGDVESHCVVGRSEVAKDSQVGRLLNPN
ncbi:DUF5333 domain-containing protein [Jannaschia aquimarina]|uniref:DUF5333 domain-containing protein n=1 Tax=Jannaschia aquimarina TaxID=935700 RepID=A0A0D1D795_9RHOB|nr:DUF5333 domain-containing protein [Jannaschia aquimarina]KIT15808.1 hypothetical protein jaqu_23880 [Jannaschia aquimarina]SNT09087.1 hypothetical protein SAMN05421775_105203 [Jannaschia aquimarina]